MHVAALIDLLYETGAGKSLQRSISSLQTAARLSERPAPPLADVAAAYLVRAERARTPRDLLAAIEAAAEALEHEPKNLAARYNVALALERFGLIEEAADAWRDYLAADAASGWSTEARRHLDQVLALRTEPGPPAADAPLPAYRAYAAADPQRARELGWCRVLGAWAEAALAGNAANAEAHLERAEALGRALERRRGGDATLSDAVRAIRSERPTRAEETLAIAHREFAAGCALADEAQFHVAASRFAAAMAAASRSPALWCWAQVLYGDMIFHDGDVRRGEAILRKSATRADTVRHPALAGRARQGLAALLLRGDRYEAGLEQANLAAALFEQAGERENTGIAVEATGVAYFGLQEMDQGFALVHRALEHLRPYRSSYRLHNLLTLASQIVGNDGFVRAAVRVQDEGVRVAERTRNPVFVAEARLVRARLHVEAGALAAAGDDVIAGRAAIESIDNPGARRWMVAQHQMAEAITVLRARPALAATALDSATAFFLGMHAPLVALPAVVGAAEARLAAGDDAQATARLDAALVLLEQRRDSIRMEPRRAAVFEAAREVVNHVVMLKLGSDSIATALAYLDRGRASLATVGGTGQDSGVESRTGPAGEVALVYGLVADSLLIWTVKDGRVELFRTVVDTVRLELTIERLRQRLEEQAAEAELRADLSRLHEWLIRPVMKDLGGVGAPLVVIVDGQLASVPFAALYDTRRQRYLVEDHPLRFAASLREARRPTRRTRVAEAALFVADPAFSLAEHPGLERLTGATQEVGALAAGYPGARVLSDKRANQQTFLAALRGAEMVHYAGHAVFDDERPERSYLLLAPTNGQTGSATLEAGDIAQLDLRHLSLVVLSACQTVRTGPGRAAGFSGLAGAFLAAGAGGAAGSLWEVDDRLTAHLMVEFHRAYRASGNAPAALRTAQRQLLGSGDEALRSPAAWASFRYTGN